MPWNSYSLSTLRAPSGSSFDRPSSPSSPNSTLSSSLRSLSITNIPEDATQSQRANGHLQDELSMNFLYAIIVWSVLFLLSVLSYHIVVIWSFVVFNSARDLPPPCQLYYRVWMWCFISGLIFVALFQNCIKRRLGYRQGEPIPEPVARYDLVVLFISIAYFILGLAMSNNEESKQCMEQGEKPYITSWRVVCALGLAVNVILYGGFGGITTMLVWMARNGLLSDEKKAAPADTVANLPTVAGVDAKDSECSICLSSFADSDGSDDVIKETPCGHCFHQKCLENWFKCSRTCPNCRVDVVQMKEGGGKGDDRV